MQQNVRLTVGALLVALSMLAPAGPTSRARAQRAPTSPNAARTDTASIRLGVLVKPESVTVGDPFVFMAAVRVAFDARVEWPAITDSAATVVMREPVHVSSVANGAMRTETATYALTAWDIGTLAIGLPEIVIRTNGAVQRVSLANARIVVNTVLPRDTAMRVPKAAKALFPREVPWWERWWLAIAIAAALLLLWWFWKRRRVNVLSEPRLVLDDYTRARRDFEQLERLALVDAGEGGRYVALSVDILRAYLQGRIPAAALSRTTTELVASVRADSRVPQPRLLALTTASDAIKFANEPVDPARAHALGGEAQAMVEVIEQAEQARVAAEVERLRAQEVADKAAASRDEEAARRRSRRAGSGAA